MLYIVKHMKKLILSAMLMAFALAVNAADTKACTDKDKGACCAKASTEAKASCPMMKDAKATCPFSKNTKETVSKPLATPKGAEQAKK